MNPIFLAALWMSGAIVSFSTMAISGRIVAAELDTFEVMMYRSFVGLLIICILTTATGNWKAITTQNLGTHALRNIFHFIGQNLWFFALGLMPLAQLFALEFTTPIWVLLLSPLLLRSPLRPIALLAAVIAFIGILIVARPGSAPLGLGFIIAASCAIFFALTFIFTKRLTQSHSTVCILFYLTLMQAGFGVIAAGYDLNITRPSATMLPYVILIGLAGLLAHFCITNALKIAPASVVAPFDFVRLPVIAVVGAMFFSEPLDIYVLFGAVLIFLGNYLNILSETRKTSE
ncbi:DMT family transporter [Cognatishimia sp. WU-CL00825]|uniref:DMT family transporter n=1 Tax=Cognatishimia sp. WU-CL00825 TaxID=3127658 RepID=UPI00310551B3